MWTAVAMTALLTYAPGQVGNLKLNNIRATHGIIGAPRKNPDGKLLPGEVYCLTFDIEGLKVGEDGKVLYAVGMEWTQNGKVLYAEKPQPLEIVNSLGGSRVPAFVAAQSFPETPPGKYQLKAIVKDRAANTEATFSKEFEIGPREFGLVRLGLSHDVEGKIPAPPVCVTGQRLQVNFWVTGFERDKTNKQPNVTFKMRVLERGKPVLTKDAGGDVKTVPEDYKMIPLSTFLFLNRPGKFTVEIEASDDVAKKKATESFDIEVQGLVTRREER